MTGSTPTAAKADSPSPSQAPTTVKPLIGSTPAAKPTTIVAPGATPSPSLSPSGSKTTTMRGLPPFKMEKPDQAAGRWFNFMCYGKPGAGKTTLMGTAADVEDMRDILFVDAESGNLAIEQNDRIKNPQYLLNNRVRVTDFKSVAMVHQFLTAHCKYRDENNIVKLREYEAWLRGCHPDEIDEPTRFRAVMVDSLTEIDIYCTYGLLGITQEKVLHGESSDIDVARFDEFRKNNQMMQMLCRAFRDLPLHFLASCGNVYAEDEQRKRYYSPALTGQLKTQVPGFFDMVGYMAASKVGDKIERRLYVNPVGSFEAKNRRSVYKKDFFEDPTMTDIMRGIGLLK